MTSARVGVRCGDRSGVGTTELRERRCSGEAAPSKIIFEAKSATKTPGPQFGQSCKATPNASSPYYRSAGLQPVSIADLLRAPIAEVKILRYGAGWKNQDDIRERLLGVLGARTSEIFSYEPWYEPAFTDIVASIQFADKAQDALEVSSMHVCFTDHLGTVIWTRLGTRVTEKRSGKTN